MADPSIDPQPDGQPQVLDYAPFEPPQPFKWHRLILTPIVCGFGTFFELILAGGIISSLPRPMQGEAVTTPWWLCLSITMMVPPLLVWAVVFLRGWNGGWRLYALACVGIALLLLAPELTLDKAYRRGW